MQCNAQNGNCWCVNINGLEYTETKSKKIPNCATPGKLLIVFAVLFDYFFFSLKQWVENVSLFDYFGTFVHVTNLPSKKKRLHRFCGGLPVICNGSLGNCV